MGSDVSTVSHTASALPSLSSLPFPPLPSLLQLVDYMIGDGPSRRYALICSTCYSHNGMTLQDEFEYTCEWTLHSMFVSTSLVRIGCQNGVGECGTCL